MRVTDPKIPWDVHLITSISEPGASTTGTAVHTVMAAERAEGFVENKAVVTGTPGIDTAVTDLSGTDQGNDTPPYVVYITKCLSRDKCITHRKAVKI